MKVFIFDVDGTLTPSRQSMTTFFDSFFFRWANRNLFYLVSGSDLEKMKEQIPEYILELAQGLFCCGGNQLYVDYGLHYENKFKPPETLLTYLGFQVKLSETPVQASNHREDRGSMLNFSVVGRDCTLEERAKYFEWDNQVEERKKIAKEINDGWPELEAVIGGQISIDIVPKGMDKSQILKHIEQKENADEYIFFGDRTEEGGNDYPLSELLKNRSDGKVHEVKDWQDTYKYLTNNKYWN